MNIFPIFGIIPFVIFGIISLKLAMNADWSWSSFDKVTKVLAGSSSGFCFMIAVSIVVYTIIKL